MARPRKLTVDYFPHFVKSGRTIFILERKYGNDGYAFWFKLLEILGETEGHYYDCKIVSNWEYLLAKTRLDDKVAESIIATLIDLEKVDAELWQNYRVIWVENFVNNIEEVYRTRNTSLPEKPNFLGGNNTDNTVLSEKIQNKESFLGGNNTRKEFPMRKIHKEKNSIEKETRKETIKKKPSLFHRPSVEEVQAYITEKGYELNAAYIWDYYESNGWKVGKNPMRDWKAAVRGWANRETEYQKQQQYGRGKTNWMSDSELAKAKRDAEFNEYLADTLRGGGDVQGDVRDW